MPDVITVPIGKLVESPLNPRKHYDQKSLEELAASMKEAGQLVPLLTRPVGNKYEIAAGHRRLRAAKIAKLKEMKIISEKLSQERFLQVLTIENLEREDVHPLDEAVGFQTYMRETKSDVKQLTQKLGKGKSLSYVYQRLKLLDLVPRAKQLFLEGKMSAGHAILVARLTGRDQEVVIKRYDLDQKESVRSLAAQIGRSFHNNLRDAPFKTDDATLVKAAGPCTTCPKRTGFKPDLFPEIREKDTCTDRECFAGKVAALLQRKRDEIAAKKGKWANISESNFPDSGLLARSAYNIATDKCPAPIFGIVSEGKNLGTVKKICISKECKVHKAERAGYHSSSFQREQAAARRSAARARAVRTAVILEIRRKVTTAPTVADVKEAALHLVSGLDMEVQRRVFELETGEKTDRVTFERRAFAPLVEKMKPAELNRFLVTARVAPSLVFGLTGGTPVLDAVAKKYRVSTARISGQLLKAEKAAKAARSKKKGS